MAAGSAEGREQGGEKPREKKRKRGDKEGEQEVRRKEVTQLAADLKETTEAVFSNHQN